MNHFQSRVISLLLAILFLSGAGMVCFHAVFRGTVALAATVITATITKVDDKTTDKLTTANDQKITIDFQSPATVALALADTWTIEFDSGEILQVTAPDNGKCTIEKAESSGSGGGYIGTATVGVRLSKNSDELIHGTLTITRSGSGTETCEFTLDPNGWLPPVGASPNTYNLQSYRFYDSDGDRITKLTKGKNIDELVVTIKEGGVSKKTYDDASKGAFNASLNYDVFEPRDRYILPSFSSEATELPDGCISYTVTFRDLRYNADTKQLIVKIGYPQEFGLERREFTETLPEGELSDNSSSSSSSEESSSTVEPDPPTPRLIITSYDYGEQEVYAASNATLNLTFKNMSKQVPVDNVVLKVTMPEAFTLTNSSNTFYFERIGREREETVSIPFAVKPKAEAISHAIKLSFSYEPVISDKRSALTSDEEIAIPVMQRNRMTLTPAEVPPEIYMGDNSNSIEVNFVNKGKTTVYNVTVTMEGENLKQAGSAQFIGNMDSGVQKSADFTLEAVKAGEIKGEIVLTYEDDNMQVGEQRMPFSAVAMDMESEMPPEMPMPEQAEQPAVSTAWYDGIPVWYWIVGSMMGVVVALYLVKLAKVSRLTLQEEEDESF